MMRATSFEYRHQTVLHVLLVGLALATYLIYPDDIVWALVRHHANNRLLARITFGVGAIVVLGSAALETWGTAYPQVLQLNRAVLRFGGQYRYVEYPLRLARLLFALALGLLLPLPGTMLLIAGETILVLRLLWRDRESAATPLSDPYRPATPDLDGAVDSSLAQAGPQRSWSTGFRAAASKWGLTASMILLAVTLRDRIGEIAAGIGFFVWLVVNTRSFTSSKGRD
jgi:hypothetical protein